MVWLTETMTPRLTTVPLPWIRNSFATRLLMCVLKKFLRQNDLMDNDILNPQRNQFIMCVSIHVRSAFFIRRFYDAPVVCFWKCVEHHSIFTSHCHIFIVVHWTKCQRIILASFFNLPGNPTFSNPRLIIDLALCDTLLSGIMWYFAQNWCNHRILAIVWKYGQRSFGSCRIFNFLTKINFCD